MDQDQPPNPTQTPQTLTSGRRLARNTIWSLVAQGAPLTVALVVIPFLLRDIGVERFGVLTLIWALIGYASLFDFGLGRAMTKLTADRLGLAAHAAIPPLLWTGLGLMLVLGLVAGLSLLLIVPWVVRDGLHVAPSVAGETLRAFQLVALGIPVVVLATGLRGVMEAHQEFRSLALINGMFGAFTFLGPLLAEKLGGDLAAMAGSILAARGVVALGFARSCLKRYPALARPHWQGTDAKSLLRFGGWMTVSNLVGPFMDNMDRFLLGAMTSVAVVAFYATPYDVVTRALLIPIAFAGVLFPAFSTTLISDAQRARNLFVSSIRHTYLVVVPITLFLATFAREGLDLWLGAAFALNSEHIVQWLAAGVLLSAISKMPYALLQAKGRPDLTALAHMIEFPLYLITAWFLIKHRGAEGAAIAWTLRVFLDAGLLFFFASRELPGVGARLVPVAGMVGATLAGLGAIAATEPLPGRLLAGGLIAVLLAFGVRAWILDPGEIQQLLRHFRNKPAG